MAFQADDALGCDVRLVQSGTGRLLPENADFLSQVSIQVEPRRGRDKLDDHAIGVQQGVGGRGLIP